LLLAAAASRTSNVLLLGLLIGVTAIVVAARAGNAPWARSYPAALKLGLFIIAIRMVFQILFGAGVGTTVAFTLPEIPLPEWAVGIRIGGEVTVEGLVAGLIDGVRLATIIACFGAANALTGPTRLLKSVPGALYEMGVAVVVALSLAPQLVLDAQRVSAARRLRGRSTKGVRGIGGLIGPVLDGSLRRSLDLAAAMDARGYGRTAGVSRSRRHATTLLVVSGVIGIAIGIYGLLDGSSPALLGLPMLIFGALIAIAGLRSGGRRTARSHYRPDPFGIREVVVVICGAAPVFTFALIGASDPFAIAPSITPLVWPTLAPLAVVALGLAALPAVIAPPLPAEASDAGAEGRQDRPSSTTSSPRIEVAA
jgi:energy-coupling factor transport system permease protein